MVSNIGFDTSTVHLIGHALAVADSQAALADVRAAVGAATPAQPLVLELTADAPTVPALQILLAAARGLDAAGGLAGFGPHATAALAALSALPTAQN